MVVWLSGFQCLYFMFSVLKVKTQIVLYLALKQCLLVQYLYVTFPEIQPFNVRVISLCLSFVTKHRKYESKRRVRFWSSDGLRFCIPSQ